MSFFLALFQSGLRTQAGRLRTWALLFLLPLMIFGTRTLLPAQEMSTPVQVGVVLPETGGEEFWSRLNSRSGLVVTFYETGLDQARRQVATGQWDCALVLPEDFSLRLSRQDTYQLFTLLTGPGSTVYPMVRETVSACVAECISPGIAERYLLDSGIAGGSDSMLPRLNEVLPEQDRVLISMETADGRPLDPLVLADSGWPLSAGRCPSSCPGWGRRWRPFCAPEPWPCWRRGWRLPVCWHSSPTCCSGGRPPWPWPGCALCGAPCPLCSPPFRCWPCSCPRCCWTSPCCSPLWAP